MNMPLNKITNTMLLVLISILPLGLFTVKGWASGILFVCSALSLIKLIAESMQAGQKQLENQEKFWPALILLTLMLPLTSAVISSGLRSEWIWEDFDAQSRFFLGALVFYAVFRNGLEPFRYLQYSIPIGLILTIVGTGFLPGYYGEINLFDNSRLAIYFVDPLTLGYLSLTLGILSFFSIYIVFIINKYKT
jgi:O-antigen ligase